MTSISHVRVERLTKVFGKVRALAGVSLELSSGEVLGVMGPNGAGKSTLLGILSLGARPTRGTVYINGETATGSEEELRRGIGLLSHQPMVYPDLTARENLTLFASLYGVAEPEKAVAALEEHLGLGTFAAGRPTRVLSRGQLQRVALARALVATPDLLLLDEPAAGLDSSALTRVEDALGQLTSRGGIAVIVTHEPDVACRMATRAVMMRAGRIAADVPAPGSVGEWRDLYHQTVEKDGQWAS